MFKQWEKRYEAAQCQIDGRVEAMEACQDELERDLTMVGVTALEDKLQEGVGAALSHIRAAGIKVWVLTGDKVDTAINIGFACSLVTPEMRILRGTNDSDCCLGHKPECDEENRPTLQAAQAILDECNRLLSEAEEEDKALGKDVEAALVLDTHTIHSLFDHGLDREMYRLAARCVSVVCARVSPDQKGTVVKTAKKYNKDLMSLAIGDGANDVNMIQEACVGVGISGLEGRQAVNASDFAIAQFRFLERLLLVHGYWSYRRVSILILYMFYKNVISTLPQFMHGFYQHMSGQNVYLDYPFYQLYNVFYTSFPIMIFGTFDQDVNSAMSFKFPALYQIGRKTFSIKIFWKWFFEGCIHAAICFFFPLFVLDDSTPGRQDGHTGGLWFVGTVMHLCVVIIANGRLMLETRTWNWVTLVGFFISMFAWIVCVAIWGSKDGAMFMVNSIGFGVTDDGSCFGMLNELATPTVVLVVRVFIGLFLCFVFRVQRSTFRPASLVSPPTCSSVG